MARKLQVEIVGEAGQFKRTLSDAAGHANNFGNSLMRVGKIATAALAGGVTAGLVSSVHAAVDFEAQMRNVNSIAKLGEKDFNALGKSVTGMAAEVGQKPKVLAEGLYDIVSSGFKASAAVKILKVSAKAATAGMTDTATATKAVVASLNAYHMGAGKARAVSDILFQTVNKGVLTFEELSENIGDVLPSASALKVPLTDLGGALATITLHGVNAAEASTQVKSIMQAMLKPSVDLKAEFKHLGYESAQSALKQKGLVGVIDDLSRAAHGNQAEIAKWFPNVRALSGFMGLAGKNIKLFKQNVEAMDQATKGAGITSKVFAEQSKSLAVQWKKTNAAIDVFKIQIGQALVPALRVGLTAVSRFLAKLNAADGFRAKIRVVFTGMENAVKALKEGLFGGTRSPIANMPEVKIPFDGVVQKGIKAVDWSKVGSTIMDGLVKGLSAAGKIAGKLSAIVSETVDKIDWEAVGTKVGPALAAGFVAGLATLLSPGFWARHWDEMLAIALAAFPVGRLAGLGMKLIDPIIKPISELLGPLLARAMDAGVNALIAVADRLPPRLASLFLATAIRAGQAFAQLPGLVGEQFSKLVSVVTGKLGTFKTFLLKVFAFDVLIHIVSDGVSKIGQLFSAGFDKVKSLFASFGNALKSIAFKMVLAIVEPFSHLPGRLGGWAKAAKEKMEYELAKIDLSRTKHVLAGQLNALGPGLGNVARAAGHIIGTSLGAGVADGIGGMVGSVIAAAERIVNAGVAAGQHAAKARSPSRETYEKIGVPMGQGIVLGFLNSTNDLPDKISDRLRKSLEAGKKVVEGYRSAFEKVFSRLADLALRAFDAKTQAALDKFAARAAALTPAEQEIKDIQDRRGEEDRQQAIADAQQRLSEAQAGGDPAAIAAAQRDLDRALEDERIASLQRQADAERAAQEAKVAEDQKNYEFTREQQRQHFEDQLTALETALESGHITQKQFHKRLMALYKKFGVEYQDAGQTLGSAFAAGLEGALKAVTRAAVKLANAIKRILKLRSPAEEGPLSDLDTWWVSLGDMLAGQLEDVSKVQSAAERFADALRQPIFLAFDDIDARFRSLSDQTLSSTGSPSMPSMSATGGVTNINVDVHGSVLTETDLVEAIHGGLLRKQNRNGTLGFRT